MIKGHAASCTNHQVELRKGSGPHAYQLWCKVCNKHVQWVRASDALKLVKPNKINTATRSKQW